MSSFLFGHGRYVEKSPLEDAVITAHSTNGNLGFIHHNQPVRPITYIPPACHDNRDDLSQPRCANPNRGHRGCARPIVRAL